MADDTYHLDITDDGTIQAVVEAMTKLGVNADAAFKRVQDGFLRMGTTAQTAANNNKILADAEARTGQNATIASAALDRMTNSEINAANAAKRLSDQHVTATNSFSTFGKAAQLAAGYLTVHAYEEASDSFVKISNSIKQATTTSTEFNSVLSSLTKTSLDTGTSLEANTKLFFGMQSALKGTHTSLVDMTTAVDTIAKTFRAAGTSTAEANRTIREFGEILSKNGVNSGRQFLSILTNAPQLLDVLAKGLNVTREQLLEMAKSGELTANKVIAVLDKMNAAQSKLAGEMEGTISQALQNINTKWILYIGSLDKASGAHSLIINTLTGIANNLNILIPLTAAFIAAWTLNTVLTTLTSLKGAIDAIWTAMTAFNFVSWFNPWTIGLAAVVAGIAAVLTITGKWGAAIQAVKDVGSAIWSTIQAGASAAMKVLQPIIDLVEKDFVKASNDLSDALNRMFGTSTTSGEKFSSILTLLKNLITGIIEVVGGLALAIVSTFTKAIKIVTTAVNWVNKLIDAFRELSSTPKDTGTPATASAPVEVSSAPASFGHARSGLNFSVPGVGTSGPDSRLVQFMATPGEQVTVSTPAQQMMAGLPRFRNGGSIGVTGDLRGINVNYVASNDNSVTGYQAPKQPTLPPHLAAVVKTITQNAPQVTYPKSAPYGPLTVTNFGPAAGGSGGTATASAGPAQAMINGTTFDPQQLFDRYMTNELNLNLFGSEVSGGYGGAATFSYSGPDGNYQTQFEADEAWMRFARLYGAQPWSQAKKIQVTNQLARGSGAYNTSYFSGFTVDQSTSGIGGGGAASTAFNQEQYTQGTRLIGSSDYGYVGTVTGDTAANFAGGNIPGSTDWWNDKILAIGSNQGGSIGLGGGGGNNAADALNKQIASTIAGGSVANRTPFASNLGGAVGSQNTRLGSGSSFSFREGGDFTVPGAGAVDSRMIAMHVSPGEEVSVRNRQQQAEAARGSPGKATVINMVIKTPDANSFRRSRQQIENDMYGRLRRFNNR